MDTPNEFVWHSAVQPQEIDLQNIVNNAAYLQYFDRARVQYLLTKGVDWEAWHKKGFNIVLVHVDMEIKHSLKAQDTFYVKSSYERVGRLKIVFSQSIYQTKSEVLVARAVNTVVCVDIGRGKAVMPQELVELLFS